VKLKDALDNYYYYTGKTSEIIRQLGFAGIAVVWVFKADVAGRPIVPSELIPAAFLIGAGLTLDLLHYVAGSLIWGVYHRVKEKRKTSQETEFDAPKQINWLTLFFFWSKAIMMIVAYVFIIRFLYYRLMSN